MAILLKIILGLLVAATGLSGWFVFKDFQSTRKQEGYDDLSIWRRLRFNFTFFFMFMSLASLIFIFLYYIFSKVTIG